MENEKLSTLVRALCRETNLHICICDISGILSCEMLRTDFANQIHAKPFCDLAKSTRRGYRLCTRCKSRANRKAVREEQPFSGYCPYGLFEAVYPVEAGGTVRCIVYAGNLLPDPEAAQMRLKKTCLHTGAPESLMQQELERAEKLLSPKEAMEIARLIGSYIRMLVKETSEQEPPPNHWLVETLIGYIREHYAFPITLRDMASLYYFNEKYIGRLFKAQTGCTFHQYLTSIRLKQAETLLRETSASITEIAQDCGFENIPYFNRLFRKHTGLTPSAYRKQKMETMDFPEER